MSIYYLFTGLRDSSALAHLSSSSAYRVYLTPPNRLAAATEGQTAVIGAARLESCSPFRLDQCVSANELYVRWEKDCVWTQIGLKVWYFIVTAGCFIVFFGDYWIFTKDSGQERVDNFE